MIFLYTKWLSAHLPHIKCVRLGSVRLSHLPFKMHYVRSSLHAFFAPTGSLYQFKIGLFQLCRVSPLEYFLRYTLTKIKFYIVSFNKNWLGGLIIDYHNISNHYHLIHRKKILVSNEYGSEVYV